MPPGDPRDRGEADAYYNRAYRPHKKTNLPYPEDREYNLTPEEERQYEIGYNTDTGNKIY